ncbi:MULTISPECIES: hypothetical protein [unclassified Crossiella]|uniref:hypothetical protein n=1 Tax=unclassified Crossiella TaxID=2620835 RepID=UPI001FFE36E1|nr:MULTISPECIES: hypothetical protein [unclassified Crossiella]MCK2239119.1 hypothetical protein [Crossiella sp. S99.2]MCK2251312.1 hypothetical protein [Crossiella sp. S99.1]
MNTAVAYEWHRARSLRSTWALLLAAGLLAFASGLYWGAKTDLGTLDAFDSSLGLPLTLGAALIAAVGVCAFGLDYQHGTMHTTRLVLRFPARIVAAKAVVAGGLSLVGGVLVTGLAAAGVLLAGGSPGGGVTHVLLRGVGVLLLALLSGLVGLALGGLLRHTAVGTGVFLVWTLVAETALGGFLEVPLTSLPFRGTALLFAGSAPPWFAALLFALVAAVGLTAVGFTLARRDS